MQKWLLETLNQCPLTSDTEDYILSRGVKEETYADLGIRTWMPSETRAPDESFVKRYGARGQKIRGVLVIPFYSPTGKLMGFEGRRPDPRWITDYRLMPSSRWTPMWLGLTPSRMQKIWNGGAVWVVEGFFDLAALEWVVPSRDVVLCSVRATLSYAHVQFLKRFASYVHIVYDEDETGIAGGEEAISYLNRVGVSCRRVRFYGGKDPGEIWDTKGEEGLRRVFGAVV